MGSGTKWWTFSSTIRKSTQDQPSLKKSSCKLLRFFGEFDVDSVSTCVRVRMCGCMCVPMRVFMCACVFVYACIQTLQHTRYRTEAEDLKNRLVNRKCAGQVKRMGIMIWWSHEGIQYRKSNCNGTDKICRIKRNAAERASGKLNFCPHCD